ncbi:adenosylmethionine decarboxylase [bacterium]|nr:adenosylmethionine decarboxylase [bacterium]
MDTKVKSASGTHIITELSGCNTAKLCDLEGVRAALTEAAERAHTNVIDISLHRFEPHGVSGVAVISESHISVHTWPELGYAALDIYTCGELTMPEVGSACLAKHFEAKHVVNSRIKRGVPSDDGSFTHIVY